MPLPNPQAGESGPLPDKSVNNAAVPSRRLTSRVWRFITSRLIEIIVVVVICGGLFLLIWPTCAMILEAARYGRSANNLQQIGLAILQFNDATGELPTNNFAPDGTPLLSWRVHILPYMGEEELYSQFHLNEPWNSPHNILLLDRIPAAYVNPKEPRDSGGKTLYRGFSNPGAVFEIRAPRNLAGPLLGGALVELKQRFSLSNLKDALSDTILVIEAGEAVEWTRPEDLDATPGKPFPKLGGINGPEYAVQAVRADGGVRRIPPGTSETKVRALITYNGGEQVSPDAR